jgi:hypothetical protein
MIIIIIKQIVDVFLKKKKKNLFIIGVIILFNQFFNVVLNIRSEFNPIIDMEKLQVIFNQKWIEMSV